MEDAVGGGRILPLAEVDPAGAGRAQAENVWRIWWEEFAGGKKWLASTQSCMVEQTPSVSGPVRVENTCTARRTAPTEFVLAPSHGL
ncbi:hypothetical protein N7492_004224 [Penicillium capsulatum]|uniref:Uncharacterized protein n=1 Tax=Penicillium capsulatum TaxID=69766 RepID=A0A9W9I9V5_9EURO|nr:hypothetical protein N7492_004224 [Penicillium capsulatum]